MNFDNVVTMWRTFNDAQATVLSSIITGSFALIVAALGIMVGGYVFGRTTRNLERAVSNAKKTIDEYRIDVDRLNVAVVKLRENQKKIDETFLATDEIVQKLDYIRALNEESVSKSGKTLESLKSVAKSQEENRIKILESWSKIIDYIDRAVSGADLSDEMLQEIDQVDRRNMTKLVEKINEIRPNILGAKFSICKEAAEIWQSHKSGRKSVSDPDVVRMREIENEISRAR